jgi:hypothetical protein
MSAHACPSGRPQVQRSSVRSQRNPRCRLHPQFGAPLPCASCCGVHPGSSTRPRRGPRPLRAHWAKARAKISAMGDANRRHERRKKTLRPARTVFRPNASRAERTGVADRPDHWVVLSPDVVPSPGEAGPRTAGLSPIPRAKHYLPSGVGNKRSPLPRNGNDKREAGKPNCDANTRTRGWTASG